MLMRGEIRTSHDIDQRNKAALASSDFLKLDNTRSGK